MNSNQLRDQLLQVFPSIEKSQSYWGVQKISAEELEMLRQPHCDLVQLRERNEKILNDHRSRVSAQVANIDFSNYDPYIDKLRVDRNGLFELSRFSVSGTPEELAERTWEVLGNREPLHGIREATDLSYWVQLYQLRHSKETTEQVLIGKLSQLLEPFFCFDMMPGYFERTFLQRCEEELLKGKIPSDHIFVTIRGVYVSDYSATEEDTVVALLREFGSDLSSLKEESNLRVRKVTILDKLLPLILNSNGMPGCVKARFLQIVATYVLQGGTKLTPYYGYQEWVDVHPVDFYMAMLEVATAGDFSLSSALQRSGDPGWQKKRIEDAETISRLDDFASGLSL